MQILIGTMKNKQGNKTNRYEAPKSMIDVDEEEAKKHVIVVKINPNIKLLAVLLNSLKIFNRRMANINLLDKCVKTLEVRLK